MTSKMGSRFRSAAERIAGAFGHTMTITPTLIQAMNFLATQASERRRRDVKVQYEAKRSITSRRNDPRYARTLPSATSYADANRSLRCGETPEQRRRRQISAEMLRPVYRNDGSLLIAP